MEKEVATIRKPKTAQLIIFVLLPAIITKMTQDNPRYEDVETLIGFSPAGFVP